MAKKSTPFPSPAKAKSNLNAVVKRIEQKTGPLPKMPEALLNKPSMNTVNPSVIASVRDRAKDAVRSVGSGPSMGKTLPAPGTPKTNTPKQNVDPGFSKTMPAPRNYGGMTAQPMPAFPGDSKGGIKTLPIRPTDPKPKIVPLSPKDPSIQNMPYIPPKDGSGPKAEKMPYIPPKDGSGPKAENMPYITPGSPKLKPAKPFTPPSKKMGKAKP
jgi:hypothetical protein